MKPVKRVTKRPANRRDRKERKKLAAEGKKTRKEEIRKPPPRRVFPEVTLGLPSPVRVGEWLLTTRPGCERDLIEELAFTDARTAARVAGPSLVATVMMPHDRDKRPVELAFARQGFLVSHVGVPDAQTLARAITIGLKKSGEPQAWALDGWVPDADATNSLQPELDRLMPEIATAIPPDWAARRVPGAREALGENGLYAQVCLLPNQAAAGVGPVRDAPSLARGGRLRIRVPNAAPSRAAMKLAEAFAWLDRAPEPGDVCVDIGAAPGGWSWVLLQRGAKVYAVDPAQLAPSLRNKKNLTHLRADAFHFDPGEPVDWLFSDMAWRPLEAAALLAKWGRRGWARLLVANIKLPMKKKAEYVFRVREILTEGGWTDVRARQLYHDRDEVTFAAVRIR